MLHFSNQELASAHHVSVRTVRNWIESARDGKLDLSLRTVGQRTYIANTSKNSAIIKELVTKGKKYRPHRSQKTVMPQSKFYDLYTQEQLYDLVANLEINHEIPRQYNYFGEGAHYWDEYVKKLAEVDVHNNLTATIELLELNQDYIDDLLKDFDQINVVDVGVGNAMPVRGFLQHLLDRGKMGRYLAIDISPSMLNIAESNIKEWFGDKITFERHSLDIEHDRFGYLLADEYIKSNAEKTSNLILFFGGTIQNFSKPDRIFEVLHGSMGVKDFLLYGLKLDTSQSRQFFHFNAVDSNASLAAIHRYIFDLLNVDETYYEMDMGYDPRLKERYIKVRLKIALSIHFSFSAGERILTFDKGDTILLWRARHYTVEDVHSQLLENDLYPLQSSHTDDKQFLLTVSRIQRD
jgi:uncharacterized SAM-dependent methyltransferase